MSNGESQTDSVESGDETQQDTTQTTTPELQTIRQGRSKKDPKPQSVFEDSGMVAFLQNINPKYKGWNSARLRSELLKNDNLLNEFSDRIISDSMEMNEELAMSYEEDPQLYQEHRNKIKSTIENRLSNDILKGETTKESILNRTFELRDNDLTSFKGAKAKDFEHQHIVEREARKHGLDPDFVNSVIEQESNFKQDATSPVGAMGYMQLMPETAQELGIDPSDPEQNIKGGVQYLAQQIENSESIGEALARYNAGMGNVQKAKEKAKEQGGTYKDYLPKPEETLPYIENIVGSYQKRKGAGFEYDAPISEFKEIAESNPDKYREMGIVNEEGKFRYEGERGEKSFLTKLQNNEGLHKELLSDRYELFKDDLATAHNTGAIDEGDVDDMAKAWSVYDQFGKEGLTRYLNVEEHYQENVPLEEQPQSVQEGINYLKNSSQDGLRPGDYVKAFFGSEDSAVGKFEVTPITRSAELDEDVEKDTNNWTKNFHNSDNPDEAITSIVNNVRKRNGEPGGDQEEDWVDWYEDNTWGESKHFRNINEAYKEGGAGSAAVQTGVELFSAVSEIVGARIGLMDPISIFTEKPTGQMVMNEDGKYVEATNDQIDYNEVRKASESQIAHDLANGLDTDLSRAAKIDILREAQDEEGMFGIEDLARTVMANHDSYSEKEGNPIYKIDYENADPQTRVAIDALRHDEEMSKSFYRGKDGNIIFEPNYLNRVSKKTLPKYATSLNWEKKVVSDSEGNPIGYTERPAEQDGWQSLGNTLTSFGYQSMKFADDHFVKPFIEKGLMSMMDEAADVFEEGTIVGGLQSDDAAESIRNFKNTVESGYASTWRENLDTEITREMEINGPGDILPNVTAWATPFAAYLASASKIGKSNLQTAPTFLKQASKVRKKASAEAASMFLKPQNHSKWGLAASKLAQSAEKSQRWNSYGKFILGSIPLEASGGDQWSIFGQGLADMVSRATFGDDVDLEKRYKTSKRATQIGMDILGVESVALLADNLLLGTMKFGAEKFLGKTATGRTFVNNTEGFEKVAKPEFSSESVRFFHNMFNGLQDQVIGQVPESLANRVTGRAFMQNPENVNSVADAVTRFTEESGEIFANAKSTIRNSIREYDKQFGGEIRFTEEQVERRTAEVYDEFMDKIAGNMKGFLEKTSDDATLPFKISNLLAEQAPRFKGQVPYMSDNGPKHLMTRSEANELASTSYRYVVKPAEGGDYARVFEIEDGLWTTELANRIKYKYTETDPEQILERQVQASGISQQLGASDEDIEQITRMQDNIRGVYGQEVEVDGIRGHIIDFDKNGFIIKDADGVVHKGVKIEELDEMVTQNLGVSQYADQLDDVVEGGQASLIGNRADDVMQEGMRPGNTDYPGITRDGRQLLRNLDQEQTHPAFITDDLRRIADENGVSIKDGDTPRDVVNRLREKGFSTSTKQALENVGKADELMTKFKNHAKSERIVKGNEDKTFQKTGLSGKFFDGINRFANYVNRSASTARKFAKLLGVDNTNGLSNMVKNLDEITKWNPSKVGDDGINANRAFLKNNNGTDEHFINVKKVYSDDEPRVWDIDEMGRLTFSEKWRRIEPNQTIAKDGSLPLYTREEIDGDVYYRPASEGEDGVFINVQNPTKNQNVTQKEVYANGIDAVEREIDGIKHYRLVNEGQQTINPIKIKERRAKIYNSDTTIKTPSKKKLEEGKKEAQQEVAEKLKESGVGQSLAFGLAGSLVDNAIDDNDQYNIGLFSIAGALLGSKRFRTKTGNLINGFTSKPVKNIFSNKASATYNVDKSVKNAKNRESYGFFVNEDNQRTVEMANEAINHMKGLGDKAVARWDDFRKSRFTESSFMWLKRLNNPTANNLLVALERINETVNQIASIPRTNFNARIRSLKESGRIDENLYPNVSEAYDVFKNDRGPQMIKDIFPNREMSDARAREQFELAVFRNRFGKSRIEDGELKYHSTPTLDRMYDKSQPISKDEGAMTLGEAYKEIDKQLLKNPEFEEFLNAKGTWFDNVKDEWLRQLNGRIETKLTQITDPQDKELLQNLVNTNQSYGQWRANLDDAQKSHVTNLKKNNPVVNRLIGFHNTRNKFTNLEEGYYPQMISETRSEAAFSRYINENQLGDLSEAEQRERFNQHYSKMMYEMNTDEPSKRVLRRYDPDGQQYDTYYGSRAEMGAELDRLINALSDKPEYEELATRISQNKDEFIQKTERKLYKKNGDLKLDAEGNPITKEEYFLKQPEHMETNVFEIQDTYFRDSRSSFRSFFDDLIQGNIVRGSNFLEKPRVKYMPDEFLEIDIDTIRRRYSTDVGRRIHGARYNMFDEQELHNNYLDGIFRHAKENQGYSDDVVRDMEDRILSIYNYANNNLNKTGRELRKQAKWKKLVDIFKNTLFGRFGYGFSWYNTFEWAVVGSHISSFDNVKNTARLFTQNKQALSNTESLLKNWDIVRKEIGSVNPDFERYGHLASEEVKGFWSNKANQVANYAADFSVAKNIGGKFFGWDVRDWGMARINPLMGDSFLGTNFVSSAINAQAALSEVRHLAGIARRMEDLPQGAERILKDADGKTWTYGEVKRKLAELGINEDRYDRFLQNSEKFGQLVDDIRGTEELDVRKIAGEEMPDHVNDVRHVMQRATEMFHGTNKLYRPESWHSPMGKALSTYSTYPFNFAMQTVNRRVRQPIKDWWSAYGKQQLGEEGRQVNAMKMLWNLKNGDMDKLRNMGLSNEAIENIPVDAYRSILKHFKTLGIGTAGYLTMDAVNDTMTYPINDASGGEQWKRLRRWKVLNPGAPQSDQMTWGDIDDEVGVESFMNVVHYGLGLAARGSLFGRYGDLLDRQYSLSRDGVMSLTPMTDMANGMFKGAMDMTRKPVVDWPQEMTNNASRFMINNTPILGSGIFGELRKGIYEQVRLKNQDDERGDPSFQAEDTEAEITIEDIRTDLE